MKIKEIIKEIENIRDDAGYEELIAAFILWDMGERISEESVERVHEAVNSFMNHGTETSVIGGYIYNYLTGEDAE